MPHSLHPVPSRSLFQQGGFGNAGRGAAGAQGGFSAGGFGDIFEEMFGDFMGGAAQARGGGEGVRRGADLSHALEIELEEAFKGKNAPVKIATWQACQPWLPHGWHLKSD